MKLWNNTTRFYFKHEATIWWDSLDSKKLVSLPDEEIENSLLDKWSHVRK